MLTALLVGLAATSALGIGGIVGAFWSVPRPVIAGALAFASGALVTALAYELFENAFVTGGAWSAGGGMLAGAATFIIADALLERYSGSASGYSLLAASTLDGVPEHLALGVTLIGGGGGYTALLAAIFFSNLPEALGGASDMLTNGYSKKFTIGIWVLTGVVLAAAVVVGRVALSGVGEDPLAVIRAFAGGAVLAALAITIMPEAYEKSNPFVAFATTAGFLLTFILTQ